MTVIKETTHVLDNLFCLQPDSKFHAYLLENARLGLSIMDYVISGKDLRGEMILASKWAIMKLVL